MKHLLFLLLLIIACAHELSAQDEAIYNHYTINHFLVNPGAAGHDDQANRIFFNYRSQWAGFPGSPQTFSLSYNGAISDRIGIGAMATSDGVADLNRLRVLAAPSIRFQVEKLTIGFGMTLEYQRQQLSADVMRGFGYDEGDPTLEPLLDGVSSFDFSIGLYGRFDENLFFGVSAPSLIKNRLDEIEIDGTDGGNSPFRYYTAMLGYRLDIGDKEQVYIEPSVMAKKVRTSPVLVDINLMAGFMQEKVLTGLTYTAGSEGALGIYLGTRYNTAQIMYSYHIFMGEFQQYNSGIHEISVGLLLPRKEKRSYDRSRKFRGN